MRRVISQILKKEGIPEFGYEEDEVLSTLSEEDDRKRVSELEWEIENLHLSTKQALQISSMEAERLKAQNENLSHHVTLLQVELDQIDQTMKDVKQSHRIRSSVVSFESDHNSGASSFTEPPHFTSHFCLSEHTRVVGEDECKPFDLQSDSNSENDELSLPDAVPFWSQPEGETNNLRASFLRSNGALRKYRQLLKRMKNVKTKHSVSLNRRENSLQVEQDLMNHLVLLESDMKRTVQDLELVLETKSAELITLESLIKDQNELMQQKRGEIALRRKSALVQNRGDMVDQKTNITYKILELTSEVRSKTVEYQRLKSLLFDLSDEIK
jgi:hypothetical protein